MQRKEFQLTELYKILNIVVNLQSGEFMFAALLQTLELQWGDPNGHFVEWTIDIGCGGMADVRVRSCHCCYSYCVVPPSPTCLGSGPSFSSISHPDSEGAPAPAPAPATAGTRKTEPVYTPGASAQDHDDHDGVDWDREAPRRCRHRDRATKNSNLKRCPGQDLDRADQRRCRNRDWARAAKRRCRDRAQYRAAKTGGAATGGSQY